MARITIEDCLKIIPNRFVLTQCAVFRARQLANGATSMLETHQERPEKPTVIALREMAAGKYGLGILARNQNEAEKLFSPVNADEGSLQSGPAMTAQSVFPVVADSIS